ncbi:alpha/beta-hydrolase [Xylariaceae sp. FL0662B]|nr:alpha/beta-hydrolase [Xylariaceae sp. FL0662B]
MAEFETIRLPHKPDALLSYHFVRGKGSLSKTHLLIFLNGLVLPQAIWQPTLRHLEQRWIDSGSANLPSLLTYDRYGQGESARDPSDAAHGGTHDMAEVVRDLEVLATEIWAARGRGRGRGHDDEEDDEESGPAQAQAQAQATQPKLILVGNSIGAVVGRLYAQTHPGAVAGLLFLDSNVANSDLVSVFPDPDAPGFDAGSQLPPDVSVAELRETRARYAAMFHPSVPNPEHLDRRNVAALLPHADGPALEGPEPGKGPWITVVEHDWETFADESLRGSLGAPKSLTNAFVNPAWRRYNVGLTRLTSEGRARGPVTAKGCGHFIQRDDPVFVAELVDALVDKIIPAL